MWSPLFRPSHSDIFEHYFVDASLLLFAFILGKNVEMQSGREKENKSGEHTVGSKDLT